MARDRRLARWLGDAGLGDEEFPSAILGSVFEASQQPGLSEHHAVRLNALVSSFVAEFPASELFGATEAPDTETFIDKTGTFLEPGSVQLADAAAQVSQGQMPVGILQSRPGKPYALTLVAGAAGALAGVPLDGDIRLQEEQAATEAPNNPVSIDASSIMLWRRHLDSSPSIMRCFSELLVGTELLADLSAAEHAARRTTAGSMGVNPATGGIWASEADPQLVPCQATFACLDRLRCQR